MPKRGRLGHDDMEYIRANAHTKTVLEIATALNRSTDVVSKFISGYVPPPKPVKPVEIEQAERVTVRQELRNSEAWKNLKAEFFHDEIKFFEETYVKMMTQLGDVLATEEMQVFHAVKYEVMMSRVLKKRKTALEELRRLEDLRKQLGTDLSVLKESQKKLLLDIEAQLNGAYEGEKNITVEYTKLQERHSDLMKALKSTRDQRIKQIETENKNGFLAVIKSLVARDEQERQGRQIELIKLAGQKEYERMGRPMKYDDGADDNPILSCDTVDLGREGEAVGPDA